MARRKQVKIGQCVYCGQTRLLTKDHIPPKNLFPVPRPHNLVTVPSCQACNKGAELDDEYFRLMIALREDMNESRAAVRVQQAAIRGVHQRNERGFKQAILASMRMAELVTPGGLYLGDMATYRVDATRLKRVASRTVRGLFYHEKGYRLPAQYEAATWAASEFDHSPRKLTQAVELVSYLRAQPFRMIGEGVFSYKFKAADADENATAWVLIFYERFAFVGLTLPHDEERW